MLRARPLMQLRRRPLFFRASGRRWNEGLLVDRRPGVVLLADRVAAGAAGRQITVGNHDSRCRITFSRAAFLLSALTTYQGACLISVPQTFRPWHANTPPVLARLQSIGSASNAWSDLHPILERRSCSSSLTLNQYLTRKSQTAPASVQTPGSCA